MHLLLTDSLTISSRRPPAGRYPVSSAADRRAQVLYHVFSELSEIGGQNVIAVDVVLGVVSFFVVVAGSLGIGTLMGLAGAFSARFTAHNRVMEPLVVVVIPYLAFIIAEMFHFSGILSYVYFRSGIGV